MDRVIFERKESDNTLLMEEGNVPYLYFPRLKETNLVKHCFTTRLGGVSEGDCASLNLSFTRGDKREHVFENFYRIAKAIDVVYENIVCTDQTHTTNIRVVTCEDAGKGLTKGCDYSDIDGLITNVPKLVLTTFYADCVPLYFLDIKKKAIGLSHSGWRGTVNGIGAETVKAMTREFGSRPEDILVAIGPSICVDCYEVSEDVFFEFERAFLPAELTEIIYRKGNGKYQLDLWRANALFLKAAGIKQENIVTTDICTCCNKKLLFSHRASHGKRGNLAAFLSLK